MAKFGIGRAVGVALLIAALAAAPALARDTGNEGGGGGSSSGGGSTGNSGGGGTTQTASASTPSLADARADISAQDWAKAISDLKAFLKSNPKNADGWNLLGFAYRNHGDLKLADSAYERALKIDPNHTGALSYQGILYVKLGELDEAKANLAKIAKICGNTTCGAYTDLAKALG